MPLLDIIIAPDPELKKVCTPVGTVGEKTCQLMANMLATMYAAPGIGLSAPQVGVLTRVIVTDIARKNETPQPYKMADPEILETAETLIKYEEGCLSFPEQYSDVARPEWARIGYLDEHGDRKEIRAEGLLATCLQHEIDHLDGLLFVDHLTSLKRNMILRKMKKTKRQREAEAVA